MKTAKQAYHDAGPADTIALNGQHLFLVGKKLTHEGPVKMRLARQTHRFATVQEAERSHKAFMGGYGGMNRDLPSGHGYILNEADQVLGCMFACGVAQSMTYLGKGGDPVATQPLTIVF